MNDNNSNSIDILSQIKDIMSKNEELIKQKSELEKQLVFLKKENDSLRERLAVYEVLTTDANKDSVNADLPETDEMFTFFELSAEELNCIEPLQNNKIQDEVECEYDSLDTDLEETGVEDEETEEDYIDITCPYCNEELSYTIWQIREGELICPMCNGEFVYDEVTGTVSESID